MLIETKYNPGQTVYIKVGSEKTMKVIPSVIACEDIVIKTTTGGIKITHHCIVDRRDTDTVVPGSPLTYTVERTEDAMYETLEDCLKTIVVRK